MGLGVRTKGRGYALQILFALDAQSEKSVTEVKKALADYMDRFDIELDTRSIEFAEHLLLGLIEHVEGVDAIIREASKNWRLERMSRVDLSILRVAVYELLHNKEVPMKVVMNEAVELAKRYGAKDAPAFVNGILDRIATTVKGS